MTNKEVKNIIQKELDQNPDLTNGHGVVLDRCLIEPVLQIYIDSFNEDEKMELWTVLEETDDGNGYKIAYDPDKKMYGLGIKTNTDSLLFLGYYGTFAETLRGM